MCYPHRSLGDFRNFISRAGEPPTSHTHTHTHMGEGGRHSLGVNGGISCSAREVLVLPVRYMLVCLGVPILFREAKIDDINLFSTPKLSLHRRGYLNPKPLTYMYVCMLTHTYKYLVGLLAQAHAYTQTHTHTGTWLAFLPRPMRKLSGLISLWIKLFECTNSIRLTHHTHTCPITHIRHKKSILATLLSDSS